MIPHKTKLTGLTAKDLDFIVKHVAGHIIDPTRLKRMIVEDNQLRVAMISDDKLFDQVMNDDEVFLKVSPALYFEILLRRVHSELQMSTHTIERTGRQTIPVFDTNEVLEFLKRRGIIEYLATMLASFTKIRSFLIPIRVRRGVLRRVRYNDMDVDSLIRFASAAEPSQRFGYYKRIGDVCLFVSGVFSGGTYRDYRQLYGEALKPVPKSWRSSEDYERDGVRFYNLAYQHRTAQMLDMADVFRGVKENFSAARKSLTYMSNRFMHAGERQLFGSSPI